MEYRLLLLAVLIWVGVILSEMATSAVAASYELALPNCPDRCGDVEIPFPFGTTAGCYLNQNDDFFVNCTAKSSGQQQPMMGRDLVVQSISAQGQLDISMFVANICYTASGMLSEGFSSYLRGFSRAFTISSTQNVFTAIGCDTYAFLNGDQNNGNFSMGCMSICTNQSNVLDGTCSGIGCCQVDIPEGVSNFTSDVHSFFNHTKVWSFNPCSFAFIVKKDLFNFSSDYLSTTQFNETLPMVLDWTIGDKSCDNAVNKSDYICGGNSTCYSPTNGYGYRCKCYEGYDGNPYLPTGCKDVNECLDPDLNNCTSPNRCTNTEGNYTCSCPKWHSGDGRKDGKGCALNLGPIYKIAIEHENQCQLTYIYLPSKLAATTHPDKLIPSGLLAVPCPNIVNGVATLFPGPPPRTPSSLVRPFLIVCAAGLPILFNLTIKISNSVMMIQFVTNRVLEDRMLQSLQRESEMWKIGDGGLTVTLLHRVFHEYLTNKFV